MSRNSFAIRAAFVFYALPGMPESDREKLPARWGRRAALLVACCMPRPSVVRAALLGFALALLGCDGAALVDAPPELACRAEGIDAEACSRGREIFSREFTAGLGAQHNGGSCVGCHFAPVVGGQGSPAERVYSTATRYDGDHERRFPAAQPFHVPPALWAAGAIDAVPTKEIAPACGMDPDLGIKGQASVKESGIGRFGRHGEALSLAGFNSGAITNELGACAPPAPGEHAKCAPGEVPILAEAEAKDLATFVGGFALPEPAPMAPEERARGEGLFGLAGCAVCHLPARSFRSDLCLHDLGRQGADDQEGGSWWRTAPLVGLRFTSSFMHDGRASTVEQAITFHDGGEGRGVVARFRALPDGDQRALVAFVEGL